MTTSTQQTASTSPGDDLSKSPLNDNNPSCPHCGNFAGYASQNPQDTDPLNASLMCQRCGIKNTDSLSFYVFDEEKNRQASPEFSTLVEAQQFAEILGITEQGRYGLRQSLYLFNGQRDQQARREYMERLAWGRQILTRLVGLRHLYMELGDLTGWDRLHVQVLKAVATAGSAQ